MIRGSLNGKPLRFFPPQGGKDRMPWVSSDDLARALGMNRVARLVLRRVNAAQPDMARRIPTAGGGETEVMPFQGVNGLMLALIEQRRITPAAHKAFVQELVDAAEKVLPELFDRDASGAMRVNSRVAAMLLGVDHQTLVRRIASSGVAVDEKLEH